MPKILLFTKKDCPRCPPAKEVVKIVSSELNIEVREYDIESVAGMAEAAYYMVLSTPSVIVVDDNGEELSAWRGNAPKKEELITALRKNGN